MSIEEKPDFVEQSEPIEVELFQEIERRTKLLEDFKKAMSTDKANQYRREISPCAEEAKEDEVDKPCEFCDWFKELDRIVKEIG